MITVSNTPMPPGTWLITPAVTAAARAGKASGKGVAK